MSALFATACAPPAKKAQDAVLVRSLLAAGHEAERLDPAADFVLAPAWTAALDADLASWSYYVPAAPARPGRPAGGITLEGLSKSRYLVWTGQLRAASVEVVRLRFRDRLTSEVELYWNGEGEDFAPQRYALQNPDPRRPFEVDFQVGSNDTWRGTITRIGIRLVQPPPAAQALLQMQGLSYTAPPEMGHGESKLVTLAGRSVEAWLARPGTVIRQRLEVPADGRLRLQAAAWLPPGGTVKIRVIAGDSKGDRVLVEQDLRQSPESLRRRWTALQADLRELAGRAVDLRFESGPAPSGSLVMWGNPRLIAPAPDRRPNVVLISLDTVRADHLSLYGYPRATSPRLDAWARRRATVFETVVASAPWTLPSHTSMFSGVDAVHHGVNRHGPVPSSMLLLPQRFRDAGYATFATTAGVLLTPELGFARGFDEFRVRGAMVSLPEWDSELAAGVDDALQWMTGHRDERFFLFFHTYEAHAPYQAREPYFTAFGGDRRTLNAGQPVWIENNGFEADVRPRSQLFHPETSENGIAYPKRVLGPGERALAATLYDSGLAHIDAQLDRIFTFLRQAGLEENTIVVVTSDHGESLFEHGLVGHGSLYDHDLLVPLVISAPLPAARGRRVASQVRSVDLAPTLLELAGLPPLPGIDGLSLVPALHGEPLAPREAWSYAASTVRGVALRTRQAGLKAIVQDTVFDPFRQEVEVYNLSRDPAELHDLSGRTEVEGLRRRLRREVTPGPGALELRVENHGLEELSGELGGELVDTIVTSVDLDFSCCKPSPAGLHFAAPPGRELTISLPDRPAGTLSLRIRTAGAQWAGTLVVDAGPSHQRLAWKGGRWRLETSPQAVSGWTGIEVRREGRRQAPSIDDEELRRGLRALGYIR